MNELSGYTSWGSFINHNILNNFSGHGNTKNEDNIVKQYRDLPKVCNNNTDRVIVTTGTVTSNDITTDGSKFTIHTHPDINKFTRLHLGGLNVYSIDTANVKCIEYGVFIAACKNLELLNMSNIDDLNNLQIVHCQKLNSLNLKLLKHSRHLCFTYIDKLTNLSLDSLTRVEKFCVNNANSLISIDMPNLNMCDKFKIFKCDNLSTLVLPKLGKCKKIYIENNSNLKSIDISSLGWCGKIVIRNNPNLINVTIPSLECSGTIVISDCPLLQEVNVNNLKRVENKIYVDNCDNLVKTELLHAECNNKIMIGKNYENGYCNIKYDNRSNRCIIGKDGNVCVN